MSKKVKRDFILTFVIGLVGSIAIGFIASFAFYDISAATIIMHGSTITAAVGACVVAIGVANEKKDNNKK